MTLDRRAIMLEGLALATGVGAEIGPLDRPLVRKNEGRIHYVDYCDTAALRQRWSTDSNVDTSVLQVDVVWGSRTLRQALVDACVIDEAPGVGLDYVIASHVVEHVPDLITWLQEVRLALHARGSLRLAVPDKRYTFDYLRQLTTLGDVLDAYVRQRRVPSGSRVLDFALNMAEVDCGLAWAGRLDPALLKKPYTWSDAIALARDAEINGTYHDVHCWVFTPQRFCELMAELSRCGLCGFACQRLEPTARNTFEFFVALTPEADAAVQIESWERARLLATRA